MTTTTLLSKEQAEGLWTRLHELLSDTEAVLKEIISEKAWLPLGYDTFAQAYDERMKGAALANSIKPYVIYAMLDEGQDIETITSATGWGTDQVSRAAEDYKIGVPVGGATVVRQHARNLPTERKHVTLEFDDAEEVAWMKEVAAKIGLDFKAASAAAVTSFWKSQGSRARKVS